MLLLRGSPKKLTSHRLTVRGETAVRGFEYRSNFRREDHQIGAAIIVGLNPEQDWEFRDKSKNKPRQRPSDSLACMGEGDVFTLPPGFDSTDQTP